MLNISHRIRVLLSLALFIALTGCATLEKTVTDLERSLDEIGQTLGGIGQQKQTTNKGKIRPLSTASNNQNQRTKKKEIKLPEWKPQTPSKTDPTCEAGDAKACFILARQHLSDPWASKAVARENFTKACDGGYVGACFDAGAMYYHGRGGKADKAKARNYYAMACSADDAPVCRTVGNMHRKGEGGAIDLKAARGFYQQACDLDYPIACADVADLMMVGKGGTKDVAQANAYYKQAHDAYSKTCKGFMGNEYHCIHLASIYEHGKGIPADKRTAYQHYKTACGLSRSNGCSDYRRLEEYSVQSERQYRAACDRAGNVNGCESMGFLLFSNDSGATDKKQARHYNKKACDMGSEYGCYFLAALHEKGEGGATNKQEAQRYFKQSCELGLEGACFAKANIEIRAIRKAMKSRK